MSPLNVRLGAAVALVIVAVFGASRLFTPPSEPEAQIRAAVTAAASAAAEQDLGGIMAIVSDQFEGPGRTTKRDIKRTLFAQMHRGQWRRAFVVSIDVALAQDAERADVVTYAVLAEGEDVESWQDVLPSSASTDRFDLAFEREGGDWRVVKARYQPADLGSLPGRPADE